MSKALVQSLLQGLQFTSPRVYDALMNLTTELDDLKSSVTGLAIPIVKDTKLAILTTQFDKTSSTVLDQVPQLTLNLIVNKIYQFEASLTLSCLTGGIKVQLGGTIGYDTTSLGFQIVVLEDTPGVTAVGNLNDLVTSFGYSGAGLYTVSLKGFITVISPGNLHIKFAQNVSNASPSSLLIGSKLMAIEV